MKDKYEDTKVFWRQFLQDNWMFYTLYLLFLLWAGYYLMNFDKVVLHRKINAMVGDPLLDNFYKYITYFGDGIFAFVIVLVVAAINIRNGLFVFLSYVVSGLTSSYLKNYVFTNINRPHWVFDEIMHEKYNKVEGVKVFIHHSFPSGHATTAFAIFTALGLISKNKFLKLVFLLIAVNAAWSRTYISQHWLTDIYFGSLLGVGAATLFYFVMVGNERGFGKKLDRPMWRK